MLLPGVACLGVLVAGEQEKKQGQGQGLVEGRKPVAEGRSPCGRGGMEKQASERKIGRRHRRKKEWLAVGIAARPSGIRAGQEKAPGMQGLDEVDGR